MDNSLGDKIRENRLYKFPHTEENEESLDQARRNQEQFGIPQMGEIVPEENNNDKRSRNNEFTLKTYKFPYQQLMQVVYSAAALASLVEI